jgi:hypothetical protein
MVVLHIVEPSLSDVLEPAMIILCCRVVSLGSGSDWGSHSHDSEDIFHYRLDARPGSDISLSVRTYRDSRIITVG